jgi:hypothetical protein
MLVNPGKSAHQPFSNCVPDPQSVSGFATTTAPRIRPFGNGAVPRRIEVGPPTSSPTISRPNQFSPTTRNDDSSSQAQGPQSASFPHYTSSPMATPNTFSMMSAPHHITSFPNSGYLQADGGSPTHESYGDMDGDNNDQNADGISAF